MQSGKKKKNHRRKPVATSPMHPLQSHLTSLTGSLVFMHRNRLKTGNRARKIMVSPLFIDINWPRGRSTINDNYCVDCVGGKKNCM